MLLMFIAEVKGSSCYEVNYKLSADNFWNLPNTYTCTASAPMSSYEYEIRVPEGSTAEYVVEVYKSSSNSASAYASSSCQVTLDGKSCMGTPCSGWYGSSTKYNCIRTKVNTGNNEILQLRLKP